MLIVSHEVDEFMDIKFGNTFNYFYIFDSAKE